VPSPEGTDTYQWMESGEPIQGKTGNSLTVVESGNYNLRIQNADNCEVQSPILSIEVNALPDKPIIASENYTENGCKDIDAIILSIANEEANVNYEWIRNDSLIADETDSSYEDYLIEGNYKVRASRDGCILESDLQIIQYGPMPPKPDIIAEGPSVWYLACSNDSAFSYEWYRNGARIEGANKHIYVAGTKFGEYVVGVSDQSCPNFSDPLTIPLGTGIESDPWAGLKIFPNPTPGLFTLEMESTYGRFDY
jgi:hypothetical protein